MSQKKIFKPKGEKKCKKQNSMQNLWDMYNENINIHGIEISIEEQKEKWGTRDTWKIISKNFQKLIK